MSVEQISDLERRVTGLEGKIERLVDSMDKSTSATMRLTDSNTKLTSELTHVVKTIEKSDDNFADLKKEVTDNTKDIAVMKSKNQWQEWVGRAVVTTIVAGILGAVFYAKG